MLAAAQKHIMVFIHFPIRVSLPSQNTHAKQLSLYASEPAGFFTGKLIKHTSDTGGMGEKSCIIREPE